MYQKKQELTSKIDWFPVKMIFHLCLGEDKAICMVMLMKRISNGVGEALIEIVRGASDESSQEQPMFSQGSHAARPKGLMILPAGVGSDHNLMLVITLATILSFSLFLLHVKVRVMSLQNRSSLGGISEV